VKDLAMIIDTDVLIWFLRGNEQARSAIEAAGSFDVSAMTWGELMQGIRDKKEARQLRLQMKRWNAGIIHIDEKISVRALMMLDDFGLSHSLCFADALIAATAIEEQQTLLTGNAKHYRCIPLLELSTFCPN